MTPELARIPWRGVHYENTSLGIEEDFYPLNYHFFDDDQCFPIEIDMWGKETKQGTQVGETSVITVHQGYPIGGDVVLYVEDGTHFVTGAHKSRVTKK